MKPVVTSALTSYSTGGIQDGAERAADDQARIRRDAERAKLRRTQAESRHHAEAEARLADAMARAAARNAPLSRHTQPLPVRASSAQALMASPDTVAATLVASQEDTLAMTSGSGATAAATAATAGDPDDGNSIKSRRDLEQELNAEGELNDPIATLRQRIASGQSHALIQDCLPMLQSIADRLANGRALSSFAGESGRSLDCTLEFLQGYVDAAGSRLSGTDRLARLMMDIRQRMADQGLDLYGTAVAGPAAASTQATVKSMGNGQPGRTGPDAERPQALRKSRRQSGAETDKEVAGADVANGTTAALLNAGGPINVAAVPESSLDKDQRKRRDDTLPLVTLRSI